MTGIRIPFGILTVQPEFKAGDLPPSGYLGWHEWAEVQHKAGLKQVACGCCGRWHFPQELSDRRLEFTAKDRRGNDHHLSEAICIICDAAKPQPSQNNESE